MTANALEPATRDFYAIAHRAGNNLHHLEQALATGVDAIECDLWYDRGRLALRHERKLPALPVLFDKWFVRWSWGELSLPNLLREINFRSELYLDIKSGTPRAAEAVLRLYRDNSSMMPKTTVSSNRWKLLDRLGRANTDMRMFYSVKTERGVRALLRRAERERPPAGTSIRHTLLSPELIERLHGAGLLVYAWTVNSDDRARELHAWGIDGIISDALEVLREGSNAPLREQRDA